MGPWMQTMTGRPFYPLDPRPADFDIDDIAHALSMICRFGGHTRVHYSVAEHSIRVSEALWAAGDDVEVQMHGLLHDAAEAYLGDVVWPLKQSGWLEGYKDIERGVETALFTRFRVTRFPSRIKHFDLVLLATEKRDLMSPGPGRDDGARREAAAAAAEGNWHCDEVEPLPDRIVPETIEFNRDHFLRLYHQLERKRGRP